MQHFQFHFIVWKALIHTMCYQISNKQYVRIGYDDGLAQNA